MKVWEKSPGLIEKRMYFADFEVFRSMTGAGAVTLERETLNVKDARSRMVMVETRTQGLDAAPPQLIRYQIGTHLGSVSLELDHQSQIISYEEYFPYGCTSYQARRSNTETPKRYRFTEKERDEETGFSYHGARYYAPWLGRWCSADPLQLVDGVNLYRYARCNPILLIDPNGTDPTPQAIQRTSVTIKTTEPRIPTSPRKLCDRFGMRSTERSI
jgi:RHS repeat-associated protein